MVAPICGAQKQISQAMVPKIAYNMKTSAFFPLLECMLVLSQIYIG